MPFTFTMPKLSPTMESGTIAKWHKKEGEKVESGELIIEVATDKATVEHEILDGGWLRKILVKEGEEASVNDPIAILTEEKDESIEGFEPKRVAAPREEASAEEEVEREEEAAPKKKGKPSGAMEQPTFVPEPPLEDYKFAMPTEVIQKRIKASPLARKLAEEKGLDLTTVQGTGPGGRVVKDDLERAQKSGTVAFSRREWPTIPPGTYEEESLSQMRKVIGQRLQEAKTFIPHFYVNQTIDAEALFNSREQLKKHGIVVSYNDFVIRACALALREHSNINSGFNSESQSVIRFKTIDISVAVSVNEGLITPIIRYADYKNLGEISVEARSLAKRARQGKLEIHEFKGGSFTVSNLGMYGITEFSAIINPPQAAILAVSGIQNVPVVKEGVVVPGKVMNVTLSSDHRVIDGVAAAEFLRTLQKYLENPSVLIV